MPLFGHLVVLMCRLHTAPKLNHRVVRISLVKRSELNLGHGFAAHCNVGVGAVQLQNALSSDVSTFLESLEHLANHSLVDHSLKVDHPPWHANAPSTFVDICKLLLERCLV